MSDRIRTAAAVEANQRYADERALNDPGKLDKAVRLVRLGVERGLVRVPDVLPRGLGAPVELRSGDGGRP